MALADQLAAIRGGPGSAEVKRRAAGALKARAVSNAAKLLAKDQVRGSVHWSLIEVAEETAPSGVVMLKVVATAQIGASGPFLIRADDPINPMYFVNPPVNVQSGVELNPDRDDSLPVGMRGPITRPSYKEDPSEALWVMLDHKLREKLGG